MLDYFSTYKYSIRNVIIRKNNLIINSYKVPKISKINYFFRINKLEDLDDVQIYNYLYFFKFFFGRRGTLMKYKSNFHLGLWTYTFRVCMYVNNYREIYNNLFNLFSEYLISIDRSFLMFGFYTSLAKIYYIIIKELNTFSERKTNIGLFNLKSNLLILINIDSKLESINRMLPKNMKIDCNDDLWL